MVAEPGLRHDAPVQLRDQARVDVLELGALTRWTKHHPFLRELTLKALKNVKNGSTLSIKQRIENDKVEARKRANLTDKIQEQKDEVKAPSLSFVENPKIGSKSVLEVARRN